MNYLSGNSTATTYTVTRSMLSQHTTISDTGGSDILRFSSDLFYWEWSPQSVVRSGSNLVISYYKCYGGGSLTIQNFFGSGRIETAQAYVPSEGWVNFGLSAGVSPVANFVVGTTASETLRATAPYDWLFGNGGSDTFIGASGGEAGVFFSNLGGSVSVNLSTGTGTGPNGATYHFTNVDEVHGTAYNDTLTGTGNHEGSAHGEGGNDLLTGFWSAEYSNDPAAIRANFSANRATVGGVSLAAHTVRDGYGGTDTLINCDHVIGSQYNDVFILSGDWQSCIGLGGNDTFIGSAASNNDSISYDEERGIALVNLTSSTLTMRGLQVASCTVRDGVGGTDTLISVENVAGSDFGDLIFGSDGQNRLNGRHDNDTLVGGGGGDTLLGDGGSDTLVGGLGADVLYGDSDGTDSDELGADLFKYNSVLEGNDTIGDFNAAQGDKLAFVRSSFGLLPQGSLSATAFLSSATGRATTSSQRFLFNTTNGQLRYDRDGTGSAASTLMATLNVRTLAASSITILAG